MSSRTLRRRLHHGDIDGKVHEHFDTSGDSDAGDEPLLEDSDMSDNKSKVLAGSFGPCFKI